jgi:hypothetical protein
MSWNNPKTLVIAASLVLLAGVGAAAWFHTADSGPVPAPASVLNQNGQPDGTSYAAAASNAGASNSTDGYYPSIPPPVYMRQPQPSQEQRVADDRDVDDTYVDDGPSPNRTYRERRHGRSKKHSIEIVAGTAAAGAAIGAIAGGGQGAAIGAVSGAGAGFAYDRLTHNH